MLASKEVRPDPDAPILVPYEINGKNFQLTDEQIQAHLDKEEKIKKAAEEAKMLEMTKTEVIKAEHPEGNSLSDCLLSDLEMLKMVVAAQNTNNTTIRSILLAEKLTGSNFTNWYRNLRIVLRYEKKMKFMEQPIGPAPEPETADPNTIDKYYESVNLEQEVACLMLSSMSPDLQRTLKKYNAYDMMKELKTMFKEKVKQELFETVKAFHACKQEDGQLVSSYLLKMKSYLETLELIGYAMPNELGVSLILNFLNKDYGQFVQNYNMHSMGKTLAELHAMLKLHEKGIPKKAETPDVLAIRKGKIQKDKKKQQGAKGKAKGKNKLAYAPKTKIPPPPKRDNLAKDFICHHCKEVVTGGGLRESRMFKHIALSLYIGNGMRVAVEAIRSFDLILPSGLIIVLDNFTNYGISVLKDNVFYFNAIPRDGIYEMDMHNLYPNVSTNYSVRNKRSKHGLDSYYLWHYRLRHINKKRMDMLQRDGLLQPTHDESHEKCKSCISGKMARKPFPHQVERAKDLLGIIHTNNEVENQLGKKIKAIRSDRGGEYLSHEFVNHMKSCGIVSQLNPPYTPQHNGVSERKNRTLLDMVRSMMNLKTLPKSFWGYALETTARILNMVPTKKVDRMPYEICTGKLPKSARIPQVPDRYGYYVDIEKYELGDLDEPPNYKAALAYPESDKWLEAMNTKMQSMKDNQVWYLVDLPSNGQTVGCKWLFKKKTDMDGNVHTFKARLVAKGFTQTNRVDYGETFSPIADIRAIRILLAIAAFYDYEIWQMDVKIAFLNGHLNEDIYMVQLEGFVDPKHPNKSAYLEKILKKFRMKNSKTGYTPMMEKPDYRKSQGAKTPTEVQRIQRDPYASAIGSIMYATAVKTILKYLRNNKDMVLVYGAKPEDELKVSCYADVSFQTDKDDTKSQTRYVFVLNGGAVDWKSAKQSTTAMYSIEAECTAAAEASMEVVWMRKFIDGLGGVMPSNKRPMEMLCDNELALAIASDPENLKEARHFQRKYQYIHEVIQEAEIILKKVHTDDNVADPFTKPMPLNKHFEHAMAIGIVPASSLM
ncbi:retrotransposon protein, putative, ty1-copia subclass [Tanacetum coccineum]